MSDPFFALKTRFLQGPFFTRFLMFLGAKRAHTVFRKRHKVYHFLDGSFCRYWVDRFLLILLNGFLKKSGGLSEEDLERRSFGKLGHRAEAQIIVRNDHAFVL